MHYIKTSRKMGYPLLGIVILLSAKLFKLFLVLPNTTKTNRNVSEHARLKSVKQKPLKNHHAKLMQTIKNTCLSMMRMNLDSETMPQVKKKSNPN